MTYAIRLLSIGVALWLMPSGLLESARAAGQSNVAAITRDVGKASTKEKATKAVKQHCLQLATRYNAEAKRIPDQTDDSQLLASVGDILVDLAGCLDSALNGLASLAEDISTTFERLDEAEQAVDSNDDAAAEGLPEAREAIEGVRQSYCFNAEDYLDRGAPLVTKRDVRIDYLWRGLGAAPSQYTGAQESVAESFQSLEALWNSTCK